MSVGGDKMTEREPERRIEQLRREADRLERDEREKSDREFHERLRRVGCEYEDGTDFGD